MKKQNDNTVNQEGKPGILRISLVLVALFLFLSACREEAQRNIIPALASKEGGTGGGPIQGNLRVQVFDRISRTPAPGVTVMIGEGTTRRTNGEGVAEFQNVFGPQDIHVFACRGCTATQQGAAAPFLFQNTSFYQVNAANLAIPIAGRLPAQSEGTMVGKVFATEGDAEVYVIAMDDQGGFKFLPALQSRTQRLIRKDEKALIDFPLTFASTQNLDTWAAIRPELGRQAFSQVALLGKVIDSAGNPQGGVQIFARFFDGLNAPQPLYFNTGGIPDPSLTESSPDGRFVILRLPPDFDLFIEADSPGIGIGATNVRLPDKGTVSITLPVMPLLPSTLALSGRVVSYHLDFQEEERLNGTSGFNLGLNGAQILFPGFDVSRSTAAGSGPIISGNYQIQDPLLQNGSYLPIIFGGNAFRPTVQNIKTTTRSQWINYPLAVVPQAQLTDILRAASGNADLDLADSNGELVGRVVQASGALDLNGNPIHTPLANISLSILGDDGSALENLYYLDDQGFVDTRLTQTTGSGGFVYFSLVDAADTTDEVTLVATDSQGQVLRRQWISLTASSVQILDFVLEPNVPAPPKKALGAVVDIVGKPVEDIAATLIGGLPADAETDCPGTSLPVLQRLGDHFGDHDDVPDILPDCKLSARNDYMVQIEQAKGGGDYDIGFDGAAKRMGLSSFQVSDSGRLSGKALLPSVDTRNTANLQNDLDIRSVSSSGGTRGRITFPEHFKLEDLKTVLIGSIKDGERIALGIDTNVLKGKPANPYQMTAAADPLAESYFLLATAQNAAGEESKTLVQGLPEFPSAQDLRMASPPTLSRPLSGALGQGPNPRLAWHPPNDGAADFYRIQLRTAEGDWLWEAFVPGNILEIELPALPEDVEDELDVLKTETPIHWTVRALRAGGLSLHDFNFKLLTDQLESDSAASSLFTP